MFVGCFRIRSRLNQCRKFFRDYPQLERVPFYDTAGSVKMLMEERPDRMPRQLRPSMAADLYGAKILKRGIEDDPSNFTRFFLLKRPGSRPREDRECRVENHPGVSNTPMFREPCSVSQRVCFRDISCTKIESRPLRGKPWEYWFYLDFLGRADDEVPQKALGHLAEFADFLRVLGTYPKAV